MTGRLLVAALLLGAALSGCGGADRVDGSQGRDAKVVVFAAASLTEVFTQIAGQLEAAQPGLEVVLSFGASSALAQQLANGAPADVFAAASPQAMETVVDARGGAPVVFARNTLQIAVPAGAPDVVLADFADEQRTLALCAPQVPCGTATAELFAAAGIRPRPDTLEQDVRAALGKVRLGEVDAALVYRTDVLAAGEEVRGIDVPEAADVVNDYPIALLSDAENASAGAAFVARVLSEDGRRVLDDAGFARP